MAYINQRYVPEDKTTDLEKRQNQWRATLLSLRKPPVDQSSYRIRSDIINQGGVDATNYETKKRNAREAAYMQQQQQQLQAMQARNFRVNVPGGGNYASNGSFQGNIPSIKGGGSFENFVNAITGQESGGNYNARNSSSGAMGRYQIMPGNIAGSGGWDKEALGYNISNSQFMSNPKLQDAIARYKLQQYYNKWGPRGAAIAWYAGPGAVNRVNLNKSQGAYPTINQYANSIMKRLGLG